MAAPSPELLGLACEVADSVTVLAPRAWRTVDISLDRRSDQLRVTNLDARLEGPPPPKPDLGMDEAARLGGVSAALTEALHLLHHQGVDWDGRRAAVSRPAADQRILTLFNDDGRPAYAINVPRPYVDALFLSEPFLDALAEAEPRIRARQEDLERALFGCSTWHYSQPEQAASFEFGDRPMRVVPAQILGTWSATDESWLWAWANTSVDERCTREVERALDPGAKAAGWALFWREKYPCEADFAARVAMLAADRLGAKATWRGKVGADAWAWLALMELP